MRRVLLPRGGRLLRRLARLRRVLLTWCGRLLRRLPGLRRVLLTWPRWVLPRLLRIAGPGSLRRVATRLLGRIALPVRLRRISLAGLVLWRVLLPGITRLLIG